MAESSKDLLVAAAMEALTELKAAYIRLEARVELLEDFVAEKCVKAAKQESSDVEETAKRRLGDEYELGFSAQKSSLRRKICRLTQVTPRNPFSEERRINVIKWLDAEISRIWNGQEHGKNAFRFRHELDKQRMVEYIRSYTLVRLRKAGVK